MKQYIEYSKEVKDAIDKNVPIVALESTIISHGMPYPENVETARNCEQIVRDHGAVPATIAILNGKLSLNLEPEIKIWLSLTLNKFKIFLIYI